MAKAVVTKTGDLVEIVANDLTTKYSKISQNVVTGFWVSLNTTSDCIDSNLELANKISCDYKMIDTIGVDTTDTAENMYNQLKSLIA